MRKVLLLLIIFSLHSATLWASDPIIGTWKLNTEKSKIPQSVVGQDEEENINVYKETEGNMIELTATTLFKDGSTGSSKWSWPKEGGVAKRIDEKLPENMLYVEIVVEPGHWYVAIMQDGRKMAMYHKMVSKDGKTLTQTLIGADTEGNPLDIMMIFDRQ